ncbi:MAG: hypothetical protein H7296_14090 [Bacteroidia bacterium]|nr:hypothetical protein [Bacteroidia bacterium]
MKIRKFIMAFICLYSILISACKKDTPSVVNNNTNTANPITDYSLDTSVRLTYTVMLVSGTEYSIGFGKKANAVISGASVSITQAGKTQSVITDENGLASFRGFLKVFLR